MVQPFRKTYRDGTSLSTFVNKVLISANPTMQDGTIFYTSITGGDTNRTNATIEMSSVNKAYIDSQICTQFGVDDISELSFKNLGDEMESLLLST